MIVLLTLLALIILIAYTYLQQPKFGKVPVGKRLGRIKASPNYKDGQFQNVENTPAITEGYNYISVLYEFLLKRKEGRIPIDSIPSIKTDLHDLSLAEEVLVWFGHSSYFLQLAGKRIVVDPVFSGNASPIPGSNKAFKGTDIYKVDDLPAIDYLFLTHDHYDHADYETLILMKDKVSRVLCGLGVGEHLEKWGFLSASIIELDWNEQLVLESDFTVYTKTARHFSGRGFTRNNTLWLSFLLQTPSKKIYIGGDSGYGDHFAEIGKVHGPIDLALLDNGQFDIKWKYIHMHPDEVLQAAKDLQAKRVMPVHSSKFAMANHRWDEPLLQLTELNKKINIPLITPMIGERVDLNDPQQSFRHWWEL
jgi:L-ascorbate metabolism protein UlaG (beta-lactamase superfamily)